MAAPRLRRLRSRIFDFNSYEATSQKEVLFRRRGGAVSRLLVRLHDLKSIVFKSAQTFPWVLINRAHNLR